MDQHSSYYRHTISIISYNKYCIVKISIADMQIIYKYIID